MKFADRTEVIRARVTKKERLALEREAARLGLSISEYLRQLIRQQTGLPTIKDVNDRAVREK